MGSGKTTLGKLLSKKMGLKFIDLDAKIEKNENHHIQAAILLPSTLIIRNSTKGSSNILAVS